MQQNSFSYERFRTRPRFEKEAEDPIRKWPNLCLFGGERFSGGPFWVKSFIFKLNFFMLIKGLF